MNAAIATAAPTIPAQLEAWEEARAAWAVARYALKNALRLDSQHMPDYAAMWVAEARRQIEIGKRALADGYGIGA
jgi:hypothetical protein